MPRDYSDRAVELLEEFNMKLDAIFEYVKLLPEMKKTLEDTHRLLQG